jgi:hypothetical protein
MARDHGTAHRSGDGTGDAPDAPTAAGALRRFGADPGAPCAAVVVRVADEVRR